MTHSLTRLTAVAAILLMCGCPIHLGDRAADRTLTIRQFQSTETYNGQFQVDTSQLPSDAVETRVDSGGPGAPVISLTIKQRYPIRVVLVLAANDKPAQTHHKP
jgi:outer membrane lipopolysaccharide assembly protein LptE/RlpB